MAVVNLDDQTFATELENAELAVVDFYASWCGPCMLMKPKFSRLSEEFAHVKFFVCDGERAPESRKTVEIPGLHYFGFYRAGKLVDGLTTAKLEGLRDKLVELFGEAPPT